MAIDTANPDSSGDETAQTQSQSDKAMLAARDDVRSIRKKPSMPAPLEQVMKEVAPAPDPSNAGSIGRVERRIMMLEKAFSEVVERHEKSLRDRVGAVSALEENLLVLRNRLRLSRMPACG